MLKIILNEKNEDGVYGSDKIKVFNNDIELKNITSIKMNILPDQIVTAQIEIAVNSIEINCEGEITNVDFSVNKDENEQQ